jgi:outer membrane protein
MDVQQAKDNLTLNVILAYLQVLSNEDLLNQSVNQVTLTQKQVDRLAILDKQGAVIPAQLYDLKGQLANDQLSVINVKNALETAKITLCQLMNIAYDKSLKIQRINADEYAMDYAAEPSNIYQEALHQLAVIKAAELRKQSAVTGVKIANGEFYPRVGLGAGLNTNYSSAATQSLLINTIQVPSGDYVTVSGTQIPVITNKSTYNSQKVSYFDQFKNNYSTSVNLNIRIPLLNAFQARNKVALAKNDVKNNEYLEEIIKTQLRQSIEQAYLNMSTAADRYKTLLQQVSDFNQSFHSADVRFIAGASTQVEYLISKNNSDRAQINLISAKYDYILRRKILDYYQGKLVL